MSIGFGTGACGNEILRIWICNHFHQAVKDPQDSVFTGVGFKDSCTRLTFVNLFVILVGSSRGERCRVEMVVMFNLGEQGKRSRKGGGFPTG